MLNHDELTLALDLHRRSYQLLLWMADRARDREALVAVIHESSRESDAALEWLTRLFGCLPQSTRPEVRHLEAYAQFFSTYLKTSFERHSGKQRLRSPCGCYCSYCAYVVEAPLLKPRSVTARDKKRARRLMEDRLIELAYEEGAGRPGSELYELLDDDDLRQAAAWSTYGAWLIRRCRGQTPGPALLTLWRRIKQDSGRSYRSSRSLFLADFVSAEEALVLAIGSVMRSRSA